MAEKTLFRVTGAAGQYVAGRKVKVGAVIALSGAQAEYELARGMIVPHTPAISPDTPEDGGSIDRATRGLETEEGAQRASQASAKGRR
ncbi:hypothetical protein [Kaistia sp. MMO-174]|uniref:hypothetical protein n=1 Tax=Kaistia sp. MMO-174 TaxID=3081256 RepID=UPI00301A72FC